MSTEKGRTVLVTGANGYIGSAVSRAFVRAGWRTFGLVRKPEAARDLVTSEILPVVGSYTDLSFLDNLYTQASTFDVIVSCTEDVANYNAHYAQVVQLLKAVSEKSRAGGVKPLVIFTSGCKDYGTTGLHGAPDLAPHTETSPLTSVELLKPRTEASVQIHEYRDLFDAVVTRPTCVYGYTNSFYGTILDWVEAERARGRSVLRIPGDADGILHALHVDDCGTAYVALAEHGDRSAIAGQAFNISGWRYETLREMAAALADEYGFAGGVEFVPREQADEDFPVGLHFVFSFSQWVGSDKIRETTGWGDRRLLFSENLHAYRLAYEAVREKGHRDIEMSRRRAQGNWH